MGNGVEVQRRVQGEVCVRSLEAKSSKVRVAPSPGVQQGSNGIVGRGARRRSSRINKEGREHRGRDSPKRSSKGLPMLVVGIDVGAEVHHVAVVDQSEAVVTKPTAFEEDAVPQVTRNSSRCWRAPEHGVAKTYPWRRRARRSKARW